MKYLKTFEETENSDDFDPLYDDSFELYGDEVTCPDCDGTGVDEMGHDCERCDGLGEVYRPSDIPPDR